MTYQFHQLHTGVNKAAQRIEVCVRSRHFIIQYMVQFLFSILALRLQLRSLL